MIYPKQKTILILMFSLSLLLAGCQNGDKSGAKSGKTVVVTTTIAGDVVKSIVGDAVNVEVLLPYGASPHDYNPTPEDIKKLSKADLVFMNGLGLEKQITPLFSNVPADVEIISLSGQVKIRKLDPKSLEHHGHDHGSPEVDPHVWTNPVNIIAWVNVASSKLADFMPDSTEYFSRNALQYIDSLMVLDSWIKEQVAGLDKEKRYLVTDHLVFGYFADRYGFEQVGAVTPSFSSLSEPSAREIAILEETIMAYKMNTIFVGKTANHTVPERISSDLNLHIVELLTGSLEETGAAATYIGYMKYNVNRIVQALGSH